MMTGEKYIDVDGIKTRYFEKGSGPVVVLFHGGHFGSHDAANALKWKWGQVFTLALR
jgi:2-hydroxy-6-oxonona-2,4-dienedioate hydrolase